MYEQIDKAPLDEVVKKEIDKWRESGTKDYDWIKENLDKLQNIYCGKETIISDHNTQINQPIQRMFLNNRFLILVGGDYNKWINAFECSFDKKYAMTITAFHTLQEADKLKIGFAAYELFWLQPYFQLISKP